MSLKNVVMVHAGVMVAMARKVHITDFLLSRVGVQDRIMAGHATRDRQA